jgi:hypothetical protein
MQGERFINAYHNISNIVLHISKPGQEYRPAVLLVAHHDSPVASPGARCCVSSAQLRRQQHLPPCVHLSTLPPPCKIACTPRRWR